MRRKVRRAVQTTKRRAIFTGKLAAVGGVIYAATVVSGFVSPLRQPDLAESTIERLPVRQQIEAEIDYWSRYYRVPKELVIAVAFTESSTDLDPNAMRFEPGYLECWVKGRKIKQDCRKLEFPAHWPQRSAEQLRALAVSYGVMQLMPYTALQMAKLEGVTIERVEDLKQIRRNIRLGVRYIRYCIDQSGGSFEKFSRLYNGPATKKWGPKVKNALANRYMVKLMRKEEPTAGLNEETDAIRVSDGSSGRRRANAG